MSRTYGEKMVSKHVVTFTDCDQCGRSEAGDPDEWVGIDFGHGDWAMIRSRAAIVDACSGSCLLALLARIGDQYECGTTPTLWVHLDSFGLSIIESLKGLNNA